MTDFALQRTNMVESQVRPSDITDRRIMRAMQSLPREIFAAEDTRAVAYMDQELAVGRPAPLQIRRTLLAPRVLARLVQLLEIEEGDRVLEIGTATGYGAAVIAQLARSVVALECDESLATAARANLTQTAIANAAVVTGPLSAGWPAEAPYAAILVSGTVPEIPPALLDQLQDGGRLAAITSQAGMSQVRQVRRLGSSYASRRVAEAGASPLPGFERKREFTF